MNTTARARGESGLTVIELVAALAVFALLFLMVDTMFLAANRGSKKAELAADVQQNARIAVERLIREVRESSVASADLVIGGATGQRALAFRSARLAEDNSVFCVYARNSDDPSYMFNANCFTFTGGNLLAPPYTGNPVAPSGTYRPIWQRSIAYYLVDAGDGTFELKRVATQLLTPAASLPDPTLLSSGDVIAIYIESLEVTLTGSRVTVALKAKGQSVVQGSAVPDQEIRLDGAAVVRN